jgi:hypothetical protein
MKTPDVQELARGLSAIATRTPDPAIEKVAAVAAALGKQADLSQILSNPYLQNTVLGAGAGGLVGALQGKKKRRAILDYALLGGIGGLGTTAAKNMLLTKTPPPPAIAAAKNQDGSAGNALFNIAGAGAGAYGGRQVANSLDAYGKLNRFLASNDDVAKQLRPTIEQLRANTGPSRVTENLTKHVRGLPDATHDPSFTRQMLNSLRRLRGADYVPRDVSLPLESAGMNTPAAVAGRVRGATNAARGDFLGGLFGRGADDASNVLAAVASEPAAGVGKAGRRLTGAQLQQALRRVPRFGGRMAGIGLPVLGALGVPALLNSLGGSAAEK